MKSPITFITSNPSKAGQLSYHLKYPIIHKQLDLKEIQSLNLDEIIEYKAKEAFSHIKTPVLVEDTSLCFKALGKLPGPLVKWFLQELGNDGLCKILDAYSTREATAKVIFGLFDGKSLSTFSGTTDGMIADHPRGNKGFGWDSIFIPNGHDKTWGEMDLEEQKATSMRKLALDKLHDCLVQSIQR